MIRKAFLFFIFLFPALFLSCRQVPVTSHWVSQPPPIDAKLTDWQQAKPVFIADSSLKIMAENDGTNFYLGLSTDDPEYQEYFRRSGITLWIDPQGGKSKRVAVYFPASTYARFNTNRGGFWQSYTAEEKDRAVKHLSNLRRGIMVVNNSTDEYRDFPGVEPQGFAAAYAWPENLLIVEVRIPLQYQSDFLTLNLPEKQQQVGIGIGMGGLVRREFEPPETGEEKSLENEFSQPRRSSFRQQHISEQKEFWLEVNLAKEK